MNDKTGCPMGISKNKRAAMFCKRAIFAFLTAAIVLPLLGCEAQEPVKNENPTPRVQADDGWHDLFTYDDANALLLDVKAAPAQEEEAYEYPWGAYDDPITPEEDTPAPDASSGDIDDIDAEREKQIQEALNKLPPEKRQAAEEALRKAQEQAQDSTPPQVDQELPDDWNNASNQPALGGRLAFSSGGDEVIIEMSEYCVDADTAFTVTPVRESKLPPEFMRGGFSVSGNGTPHVALNDAAVITFITRNDPGEDVVIKSFSETGKMEYAAAEVVKWGDTYIITGAVEHFSTVGYGVAQLPALAPQVSKESTEQLRKFAEEQIEQMRRQNAEKNAAKNIVRTIEFDEILYTKSASGHPLQLHLRAKLLEKPKAMGENVVSLTEKAFEGKIWIKFYTWMPGGYGVIYMICNNAVIDDPSGGSFTGSPASPGVSIYSATIRMATIGGSQSVGEGVGAFDISGRTYSNVRTDWTLDVATGAMKLTFPNMQGAMDKTFITGKLRAKTQRQANKKLKWFLD